MRHARPHILLHVKMTLPKLAALLPVKHCSRKPPQTCPPVPTADHLFPPCCCVIPPLAVEVPRLEMACVWGLQRLESALAKRLPTWAACTAGIVQAAGFEDVTAEAVANTADALYTTLLPEEGSVVSISAARVEACDVLQKSLVASGSTASEAETAASLAAEELVDLPGVSEVLAERPIVFVMAVAVKAAGGPTLSPVQATAVMEAVNVACQQWGDGQLSVRALWGDLRRSASSVLQ